MDLVDSSEGWAVIRLASLAKQSSREPARLLFATITELTPERMLPPPMSGFETVTVKSTKERIFFRRTLLALSDARQWYLSLQEGVCKTPLPTLEAERNLALDGLPLLTAGKLYDEKPWPQMSLPIGEGFFALPLAENDPAPFIGSTTSRIHRRFDGGGIEHFAGFLLDDEATTFVAQRMHINLRGYQEYLGSACYVSPQRILRRVENFIVDAGKEGDESLLFRFVAMPGQTVEGLELTTFDTDMNLLTFFVDAVRDAQERIWILDGYFFAAPSIKIDSTDYILDIAKWFHARLDATDVRILTKVHQEFSSEMESIFEIQEKEINALRGGGKPKCSIQIRQTLKQKFDFMHDRFAVIDDELWHFGATVGGFHTSVSAVSRGWCANETGAIKFFDLAWREMA
ncbi:TPA: VPA1262 family N-terminal domain-containing protein [Klebsiella pneumoniae]